MRYDAVIFDKDGVLLDSMDDNFKWADRIRKKMLEERGKKVSLEQSDRIARASSAKELRNILDQINADTDLIHRTETEIADMKIQKIKNGEFGLFDDVEHVLEQISVPKSVVSNAPYRTTKFVIDNFDLNHHFTEVRSPSLEDIEKYTDLKKPNPEMLEEVIEATGAENPVMIGDSDDDVKAASNAGIDSIFIDTNGGTELDPTFKVDEIKEVLEIVKSGE